MRSNSKVTINLCTICRGNWKFCYTNSSFPQEKFDQPGAKNKVQDFWPSQTFVVLRIFSRALNNKLCLIFSSLGCRKICKEIPANMQSNWALETVLFLLINENCSFFDLCLIRFKSSRTFESSSFDCVMLVATYKHWRRVKNERRLTASCTFYYKYRFEIK